MRDSREIITGTGPIRTLVVDPHWNACHRWSQVLWGLPALNTAHCARTLPEARHWLATRMQFNLLVVEESVISIGEDSDDLLALAGVLALAKLHLVSRIVLVVPTTTLGTPPPHELTQVNDYVFPGDVLTSIPHLVTLMAA